MHSLIADAQNVLVAAHDAGGAELVSAWVKAHPGPHYRCVVDGPARAVFARRLGVDITSAPSAPGAWIDEANVVLTATSYGSALEDELRRRARAAGRSVVAYLDHWVNYAPRFEHGGTRALPDELWVADETAGLIARALFPATRLVLAGNPYLTELRSEAANAGGPNRNAARILYVSEPVSRANLWVHGNARHDAYDEFDALRLFLAWCEKQAAVGTGAKIRFRAHPSETPAKYAPLLAGVPSLDVTFSHQTTLLEDCLWAGRVCGCSSMALYVADAVGCEVFCSIPAPGAACLLPLSEVAYLRDQVALAESRSLP